MTLDAYLRAESWLPVVGWEDRYEVSDQGRVKSLARIDTLGRHLRERIRKPYLGDQGYYEVTLQGHGKSRTPRMHRLVTTAFIGPRPDGMVTRHLNGNKTDNRLANLRYGTFLENAQDAIAHGQNGHASRTHCPQDHEYIAENMRYGTRGNGRRFRICKVCERARATVKREARRSAA